MGIWWAITHYHPFSEWTPSVLLCTQYQLWFWMNFKESLHTSHDPSFRFCELLFCISLTNLIHPPHFSDRAILGRKRARKLLPFKPSTAYCWDVRRQNTFSGSDKWLWWVVWLCGVRFLEHCSRRPTSKRWLDSSLKSNGAHFHVETSRGETASVSATVWSVQYESPKQQSGSWMEWNNCF